MGDDYDDIKAKELKQKELFNDMERKTLKIFEEDLVGRDGLWGG